MGWSVSWLSHLSVGLNPSQDICPWARRLKGYLHWKNFVFRKLLKGQQGQEHSIHGRWVISGLEYLVVSWFWQIFNNTLDTVHVFVKSLLLWKSVCILPSPYRLAHSHLGGGSSGQLRSLTPDLSPLTFLFFSRTGSRLLLLCPLVHHSAGYQTDLDFLIVWMSGPRHRPPVPSWPLNLARWMVPMFGGDSAQKRRTFC